MKTFLTLIIVIILAIFGYKMWIDIHNPQISLIITPEMRFQMDVQRKAYEYRVEQEAKKLLEKS